MRRVLVVDDQKEVRAMVAPFGVPASSVTQTSDRHWTLAYIRDVPPAADPSARSATRRRNGKTARFCRRCLGSACTCASRRAPQKMMLPWRPERPEMPPRQGLAKESAR